MRHLADNHDYVLTHVTPAGYYFVIQATVVHDDPEEGTKYEYAVDQISHENTASREDIQGLACTYNVQRIIEHLDEQYSEPEDETDANVIAYRTYRIEITPGPTYRIEDKDGREIHLPDKYETRPRTYINKLIGPYRDETQPPNWYEQQVDYLQTISPGEFENVVFNCWNDAEALFNYLKVPRTYTIASGSVDRYKKMCGCLTQVKSEPRNYCTPTREWDDLIKSDPDIPTSIHNVGPTDLPIFAYYQQRFDEEFNCDRAPNH